MSEIVTGLVEGCLEGRWPEGPNLETKYQWKLKEQGIADGGLQAA